MTTADAKVELVQFLRNHHIWCTARDGRFEQAARVIEDMAAALEASPNSRTEATLREALLYVRDELYLNYADKTGHLITRIDEALAMQAARRQGEGASLRDRAGGPADLSQSSLSQPKALIPSAATLPAISMWQPYASLMFAWDRERGEFAKAFETRSHKLPDRLINEWVIIHATAKFAPTISAALNDLCYDMFGCGYNYSLPRGAIIGRVRFGVPVATGKLAPFQCETELAAGDWTPGRWAWPAMEAELFAEPIPMKGAQGWWRCPASAIEAATAGETTKIGSTVGESAVGAAETPNTQSETPEPGPPVKDEQ